MRVYLGSYTSAGGGGIGVGGFSEGNLTIERWSDAVPDPSWLAMGEGVLYAVSELDPAGTVSALSLPDLAVLDTVPTGSAPAHLAVAAGRLVACLYGAGAVAEHPLLPHGGIGPATLHTHAPDGAHAHQFVPDPSGHWALVPDLGLDSVVVYAVGEAGLREHARVRLAPGSGPRHAVFSPDGARLYVAAELDSTVTVCNWREGELVPNVRVSTRPAKAEGANHPGGIAISPDGRFVYVGNRGDNTTAVLAVTDTGLELAGCVPCGGDWPRHTGLDPSGEWLFSAHQKSGDVTWFALDPKSGMPEFAGRIEARAVSHLLFA
jgi:6-phosphogluconolactonase (cycloisomerase 2 family)